MTSLTNRIQFEPAIFHLRSHDIDKINDVLRSGHWQPHLIQLEPGLLDSQYLLANLGGIQFGRITVNLAMLHRSGSPKHTISFGLPLNAQTDYTWCGHPISPQQIMVHHANREVNLSGKGPKDFAVITLDVDDFLSAGMPEDRALFELVLSEKTYSLSVNRITCLRLSHYLKELFALVQNQPNKATHPVMQKIIRNDFLPLLLECLGTSQSVPESGLSDRYQLVKQAEAYLLTHLDRPLTLQDLCAAVGSKCRTLQTAFLEIFGISPMAYLKTQRLHGARCQLKAAHPQSITVMGIATHWGFWHMGYFSRDYKRMFGESPSQTLKRV
jgi:AraC family transcriptional regulator, ethanolamine operon transcriptional activator